MYTCIQNMQHLAWHCSRCANYQRLFSCYNNIICQLEVGIDSKCDSNFCTPMG